MFDTDEQRAKYPTLASYTNPVKTPEREIVGREKEIQKIQAALLRPEISNVMLLAPAGSGKALADDTPIPVNDGRMFVRMGDLKPGDEVFDENGNPTKVLGVYLQGLQRAFCVDFGNRTKVVCNDEHIWYVQKESERAKSKFDVYRPLTLREMLKRGKARDYLLPKPQGVNRKESEYMRDPEGIGRVANMRGRLSSCVLEGTRNQRLAVLEAIIGESITPGKTRYTYVCPKSIESFSDLTVFAAKVRMLCKSLGFSSRFDEKERAIEIRTDGEPYVRIRSVYNLHRKVPMTCIYVDAPSHLFQCTENYIVTHNTALVQGTMMSDTSRIYLEVDLARMIADVTTDVNQMAAMLKTLFDETAKFHQQEHREIVLFIDEFHQIVQLSSAAVEALKPLLADSGTRGIKVIAATTFDEFIKYVSPNQPLVERLQRINLPEPDEDMVCRILRGMAVRYGVADQFYDDSLFRLIYEYTNRYIPANAQPRKSILIMDAMCGWHKLTGAPIDRKLLAEMIYQQEGVNVAFRVDAKTIKQRLDERVLSQKFATKIIEDYLQVCVADLNDKDRPLGRLLFSGSSGVGKMIDDEELVPVWDIEGRNYYKRNGDLEIGDIVFNRAGRPVGITGVYPQGAQDVYAVELDDGRKLRVGGGHLWTYCTDLNGDWRTDNTLTIMDGMPERKFFIPMNEPVQRWKQSYAVSPYVMGALIAGCDFKNNELNVKSTDEEIIREIANEVGAMRYSRDLMTDNWYFDRGFAEDDKFVPVETSDVLYQVPGLFGNIKSDLFIPDVYKYGSVEQRWAVIQGLFDMDGYIDDMSFDNPTRDVVYDTVSHRLALDIQEILFSLGISSTVAELGEYWNCRDESRWRVRVSCNSRDKLSFFRCTGKRLIAEYTALYGENDRYGRVVGIKSIRKLDEKAPMTCIMVDDPEHLYQAGKSYIVTHNTETAKTLAQILFDDVRALQRFDMSEYANSDSLERFRQELTDKVWQKPFCILLLDEIEKACPECTRLLLQVLDDARLTNRNGREVSFKNCYIILTTNAGSEVYKIIAQYNVDDTGSGQSMRRYHKLIRESLTSTTGSKFPPELLGRIDAIVPFQPLSESTQLQITTKKLQKFQNQVLKTHGIRMKISRDVVDYLVKDKLDTDSDSGGARAIMSRMETDVVAVVARFINENPKVKNIYVKVEGKMAFNNKNTLMSSAYIKVVPINPK